MVQSKAEQKQFFKDNGYVKITGLFKKDELENIANEYNYLFANQDKSGVSVLLHPQFHSSVFADCFQKREFLDTLEDLIVNQDVLLHHLEAQIIYPKSKVDTPTIQDFHQYPLKNHTMIVARVFLDDASPDNGGFSVYPGSHKLGPQGDRVDQKKFALAKATPIPAQRGDVIFYSYLLVHGNHKNTSSLPGRSFVTYVYSSADEIVGEADLAVGQSWVIRGRNDKMPAEYEKRHLN